MCLRTNILPVRLYQIVVILFGTIDWLTLGPDHSQSDTIKPKTKWKSFRKRFRDIEQWEHFRYLWNRDPNWSVGFSSVCKWPIEQHWTLVRRDLFHRIESNLNNERLDWIGFNCYRRWRGKSSKTKKNSKLILFFNSIYFNQNLLLQIN